MSRETRTNKLKKINEDLEALQKYNLEYLRQISGNNYLAGKLCKDLIERDLLPFIDVQIYDFMAKANDTKSEMINVFWLSKLLTQANLPANINENIADEMAIVHKGLYTPGLVVNQDMGRNTYTGANLIVNNAHDITKLIETAVRISILRYIVENFNLVQDYVAANDAEIEQHYKELKTINLKWIETQFQAIKTVAIQPNKFVKPTAISGAIPAPLKPAPTVGGAPVTTTVPQSTIAVPAAPKVLNNHVRPFFGLPSYTIYDTPPRYSSAPSRPHYSPSRTTDGSRYAPTVPRLSPWQQFWQTHDNTSLSERFGLTRLFRYNNEVNPASNASFFMNLIYRLLFWLHLPIIWEGISILFEGMQSVSSKSMRFLKGENRLSSLLIIIPQVSLLALLWLHAPLLIVGSFILGLTSLPAIIFQRFIENSRLPHLMQAVALGSLLKVDAIKDIAFIAGGTFLWSKVLGIGLSAVSTPLATVGFTIPFLTVPFVPLLVASATAALVALPVVAFLASGRAFNAVTGIFGGRSRRADHISNDSDLEQERLNVRLGNVLSTPRGHDHNSTLSAERSVRFNDTRSRTRANDESLDNEVPLRLNRRLR